ncbi:MAG: hypothetical protein QOH63_911 [Acidobacteriota bacterium]|jgi:uncharacterized protein (DUF1800 family)|nr:hypothetical protein [Acidobacteriota bacterium]
MMKAFKMSLSNRLSGVARSSVALLSVWMLLVGTFAFVPATVAQQQKAQRLTQEQRILHALNRLGFGARPGDVERVRAMGIDRYIEQQLHPEKISDEVADAKVKSLDALKLSTPELYAKYPQPNQLLKQMERNGKVPPELAAVVEARKNGQAAAGAPNAPVTPQMDTNGAMAKPEGTAKEEQTPQNNPEYRRAIRDFYLKNNLRPPQQLTAELQASRILRAVYSERQLQEVMVDFWTNHFNVFAGKGADRWLLVAYDRDTIRPNTFGKFYDLLLATAQSPAMLFYLDNFQSVSPNANMGGGRLGQQRPQAQRGGLMDLLMGGGARRNQARQQPGAGGANMPNPNQQAKQQQRAKRGINENYARELMELHTLGVDGGYTQKDVQEVARCFTGWTIYNPRGAGAALGMNDDKAGQFYFNPRLHDDGEKLVLGHKIPSGGGMKDGLMVLDILAHQPSTAKFIATKLARRFVSDNPSPALVERVAAAFTKSDGDIRETLRAIFTSPEFNSPEAYRAKIKRPFELAISAIRTLGGETNGAPAIHQWIAKMGQPLYGYQTPNGYSDMAENWVNTGSLLERLNFGLALASNRIPGTRVDLTRFTGDAARTDMNMERIMDRFLDVIVQGDVSPRTKATLLRQLKEPLPTAPQEKTETSMTDGDNAMMRPGGGGGGGGRRGQQAQVAMADLSKTSNPELVKVVGLILGSPEFQRQ